jgi:hypothetical protein
MSEIVVGLDLSRTVREATVALPLQGRELMPADIYQPGQRTAGEEGPPYTLAPSC